MRSTTLLCSMLLMACQGPVFQIRDAGGGPGSADAGQPMSDPDAGPTPTEDAGPGSATGPAMLDFCAEPPGGVAAVISDTTERLEIDTRGLNNRVATCTADAAPGNDAFLAIDGVAGDAWHLHLIPSPLEPSQIRDPYLYLLDARCDPRQCSLNAANFCSGMGDEHFSFIIPATGRYFIGIDDVMPGGGLYELEAIRPQCGDGVREHGEACDSGANCIDCREVVDVARDREVEPNDNFLEANHLSLPVENVLTVEATIGGSSCTYSDMFLVDIPSGGASLSVQFLSDESDSVCDSASLTPFEAVLWNTAGEVRVAPMTNPSTGCSELDVSSLEAGRYFIEVRSDLPIEDRVVLYRMRVELVR